MDAKRLGHVEVKNEALGEVVAVFSSFHTIDADSDYTMPGAFEDGAVVPISAYGHTSWQGAPPVGKGVIRTTPTEAQLHGRFFMNTAAGRDTFEAVKELGDAGQWSYGYDVTESEAGEVSHRPVRILRKLTVHEVSPVLLAAGVGTRTITAKDTSAAHDDAVREYLRFIGTSWGVVAKSAHDAAVHEYLRYVQRGIVESMRVEVDELRARYGSKL